MVNSYTQAVTSIFIGLLVESYELDKDMRTFGTLCAVLTAVPSFVAAICFYRAGIYYEQIKRS